LYDDIHYISPQALTWSAYPTWVDSRRRYALSLMIEPGLLAAAWVGA
jgi:hypothetical protein